MPPTSVDEYDAQLGYHPSVIPLDIRLGVSSSPAGGEDVVLRWGIIATGKVAHDFTQVLKFLSISAGRHAAVAVGSRTKVRAEEFAALHSIPAAHGSYEELCADPNVDIVYVASLHPDHRSHAEMALNAGKHVLVEKPMCMKAEDAQFLYDFGKKKGLFVGEGMWTRFFPAVEWTRMHLGDGGIGTVRLVHCDFNIDGDDVGPYPTDSIYARELGGGTSWTMGPYVIAAAMMPFGKEPDSIAANGVLANDGEDVGELAVGMTMTFRNCENSSSPSSSDNRGPPITISIANGMVGYLAEDSEETQYAGKGGRITLLRPAHCPTSARLTPKLSGRGNDDKAKVAAGGNTETFVEFPLPPSLPEIEASGGIQMPNSMGFIYEAEAVRRLIGAGQITFPQWTPEESVGCIRTIEEILKQINQN